MKYQVKKPDELTENEIEIILNLWDISDWDSMEPSYFRSFFKDSEFHFLIDSEEKILALMRLNFDFILQISDKKYHFAEAVGLVSGQKKKGHGKELIKYIIHNITERNLETIGFCMSELRPFYDKCDISILHKAKLIKEKSGSEWVSSDDDDILIFNLSEEKKELLNQLSSEKNAYLIQ
ncbi:hypothetical protein [Chryseobacterium sp. G0201]|uniref:hypothetical protein n=1 Tax=Chryseobacterium sp. G0201 TaxID=2487065 RepID=UPI000F51697D|nr:hypothetical protein [Chryseobacterium sp. G0201]AZA54249.1 hypothetical protein EG348_15235 [Chryseobacterium sp. G0201]